MSADFDMRGFLDGSRVIDARRVEAAVDQRRNWNAGFPISFPTFDLATIAAAPAQWNSGGFGIIFLREGSTANARIDLTIGGDVQRIAPGTVIRGQFDRLGFAVNAYGAQAGTVRFAILNTPDADYREPVELSPTVAGSSATQEANALTNTPADASDGYSLDGAVAVKIALRGTNDAATFTGGTLRFWWFDGDNWFVDNDTILNVTNGVNKQCWGDIALLIPAGATRLFVEARSVTTGTAGNQPRVTTVIAKVGGA